MHRGEGSIAVKQFFLGALSALLVAAVITSIWQCASDQQHDSVTQTTASGKVTLGEAKERVYKQVMLARERGRLDKQRAYWKQYGSDSYTLQYDVRCECSDYTEQPATVTVTDGQVVSATHEKAYTIDALFDRIQQAVSGRVDDLTVVYNRELGYPVYIEIDHRLISVDDEYDIIVLDYSPH